MNLSDRIERVIDNGTSIPANGIEVNLSDRIESEIDWFAVLDPELSANLSDRIESVQLLPREV